MLPSRPNAQPVIKLGPLILAVIRPVDFSFPDIIVS